VSVDVIKKAVVAAGLPPEAHIEGFQYLEPYLIAFKEMNPGFDFDLKINQQTHLFEGVAIIFPYTRSKSGQYVFYVCIIYYVLLL
jgi:hypothetical protein